MKTKTSKTTSLCKCKGLGVCRVSTLLLMLLTFSSTMLAQEEGPADDEIWYTTNDGEVLNGYYFAGDNQDNTAVADHEVISNTISENGEGIIKFKPKTTPAGEQKSITQIKDYAFYDCTNLTSIILPSTITNIGTEAFVKCTALESFTIMATTPPTLANDAFEGLNMFGKIHVPAESLSEYKKKDVWKNYFKKEPTDYYITYTATEKLEPQAGCFFNGNTEVTSWVEWDETTKTGTIYFEKPVTKINGISSESNAFGQYEDEYDEDGQRLDYGFSKLLTLDLSNITNENNTLSIVDAAFRWCYNLTEVILPNNCEELGSMAFYDCSKLATIKNHSDDLTDIKTFGPLSLSGTAINSIEFNENVTITGDAFLGCNNLTTVTIPAGATITSSSTEGGGNGLFKDCVNLESVTWLSSSDIPFGAFDSCTNLETVNISQNVKSIGARAFSDCTSLEEIELPSGLTSLGEYAFGGCTKLQSIILPSSLSSIAKDTFNGCTSLTSIAIPENVITIGNSAFGGCENLAEVTIPSTSKLTTIGDDAFSYCAITSIVIPDKVESIGKNAFVDCKKLVNVTIGEKVTNIAVGAFADCPIAKITVKANVPPVCAIEETKYQKTGYDGTPFNFVDQEPTIFTTATLYVPEVEEGETNPYTTAEVWMKFTHQEKIITPLERPQLWVTSGFKDGHEGINLEMSSMHVLHAFDPDGAETEMAKTLINYPYKDYCNPDNAITVLNSISNNDIIKGVASYYDYKAVVTIKASQIFESGDFKFWGQSQISKEWKSYEPQMGTTSEFQFNPTAFEEEGYQCDMNYAMMLLMQQFKFGLENINQEENKGKTLDIKVKLISPDNKSEIILWEDLYTFPNVATIDYSAEGDGSQVVYYAHLADAVTALATAQEKGTSTIKMLNTETIEKMPQMDLTKVADYLPEFTIDFDDHNLNGWMKQGESSLTPFQILGSSTIILKNGTINTPVQLDGCMINVMYGTFNGDITLGTTEGSETPILNIIDGKFNCTITRNQGTINIFGGTFNFDPNTLINSDGTSCVVEGFDVTQSNNKWIVSHCEENITAQAQEGTDLDVTIANYVNQMPEIKSFKSTNIKTAIPEESRPEGTIAMYIDVKLQSVKKKTIENNTPEYYYYDELEYTVTPKAVTLDGKGITDVVSIDQNSIDSKFTVMLPINDLDGNGYTDGGSVTRFAYARVFYKENNSDNYSYLGEYDIKDGTSITLDGPIKKFQHISIPSLLQGTFKCVLVKQVNLVRLKYHQAVRDGDSHTSAYDTYTKEDQYYTAREFIDNQGQDNNRYSNALIQIDDAPNTVTDLDGTSTLDLTAFAKNNQNVIYKEDGNYVCSYLKLTDAASYDAGFITPVAFTAKKGEYSRKAAKASNSEGTQINSVCMPFELKSGDIEGAVFGQFSNVDDKKIYFTKKEAIGAGVPCIIQSKSEAQWNIKFENRLIVKEPDNTGDEKGTFAYLPMERMKNPTCYRLQSGQFLPFYVQNQTGYVIVNAFRTYLDLKDYIKKDEQPIKNDAKELNIVWEDEATGITDMNSDFAIDEDGNIVNHAKTGVVYNLQGQPVGDDYKGLVIMNGKKILRK